MPLPAAPSLPDNLALCEMPSVDIDSVVRPIMAARTASPIVIPSIAADLAAELGSELPYSGTDLGVVIARLQSLFSRYTRRNTHPGFFGYIASGGLPIDALAQAMVGALNQNVVGYPSSPAAATIERQVIRWMCKLTGYGDGSDGVFLGGGSTANFTAMASALAHRFGPDYRSAGLLRAAAGSTPTVLCSRATHFSVQRAAAQLGIGSDQVIAIETDGAFRMRSDKLRCALEENDCAVCVVASAGTTSTGAIDPIAEIADLCSQHGVWLHVDAAYGGAVMMDPELAPLFVGIQRADSVTMDLHKWFFNSIDSSVVLFRDPKYARSYFYESSDYVSFPPDGPPEQHMFFHLGPELSRRFRALPAYMAFTHYGIERLGRNVRFNVECARYLAALVEHYDDMELIVAPQLSIVCFRFRPRCVDAVPDDDKVDQWNRQIRLQIENEGDYLMSPTTIHGRPVLRTCIINPATRASHIEGLVERIREIGGSLAGA